MTKNELKLLDILREFNEDIPADTEVDLLAGGYIDSFDIVNIVSAVEDVFGIEIEPEKIIPENFDTIEHMARLLE